MDELYEIMKADADLDNQVNRATWGQTGEQTFEEAIQILLDEYATPRRNWLYSQVMPEDTETTVIISGEPGETTARYFVPSDESLGRSWTQPEFDDSGWAVGETGIGYRREGGHAYDELIRTDIKELMTDRTSVYLRVPFDVADPEPDRGSDAAVESRRRIRGLPEWRRSSPRSVARRMNRLLTQPLSVVPIRRRSSILMS